MKKLALILAIAMIAAFAAPAMASDFTAAGQARYEAVNVDYEYGDDDEYFDQRYRVAFTWKVNDNVTTQLRADFAEDKWGSGYGNFYGYRYDEGHSTIMIDRAWVKINQGPLTLTVGQQAGSFGMIWSDQFQGIQAGLDFAPVYVNLLYAKEDEGYLDEDDDIDTYGVQVGFATDAFDVSLIYAYQDNDDDDEDLAGYGFNLTVPLEMLTLKAGLAIYDGEYDDYTDYAGTQFFIDAGFAISDAFKMGVTFIWADDADDDEYQETTLFNDLGWNYTDFGGVLGYTNAFEIGTDVFDPDDEDNGVIGGILRAQFAATDTLTFYGKLGYFEPSDGEDYDLESMLLANASVDWVWVPAVTVSAGAHYVSYDYDYWGSEDVLLTTLQLTVAF